MIKEVMHKREDFLLTKRNITIDPRIAEIFSESQNVSGILLVVYDF